MKPIQAALVPTDGYIKSFTRNTVEGWWELEIGLPKNWVYDENIKVGCEVIFENEVGKLVKIYPKKTDVVIDDLITFVEVIIKTNEKIAEKEKQFTDKMQEMKSILEKEAKQFYRELDELKENSFKKNNADFAKSVGTPRKPRKPRTPKPQPETGISVTNTVSEETETIDLTKE